MNVGEIKIRVKRQFGDESSVQVTDEDIIRWTNDALVEIANANLLLEAKGTLALEAGVAEYTLPSDCNAIRSLRVNGYKIQNLSMQQADNTVNDPDDPSKFPIAQPNYFWVWANKVILYPMPDNSDPTGISLYYLKQPVAVTTDTDIPNIPTQYHPRIVEYCLQQAYELDEDWTASNAKQEQFIGSLKNDIESEKWADRTYYPTITVLPEDY